MKKLSTLLLVLALVGFSACGKKKNTVDENAVANQFCQNGVCYNNGNGYNGYNGTAGSTAQLVQILSGPNAGFRTQTNPTETHVFVRGTIDYSTDSWWIFDYNTSNFNQTSTYNVVSSTNNNVSNNTYGTNFQEIAGNIIADVNASQGIVSVAAGVYKVLTNGGDVIYIDFNKSVGANPTQIEYANGEVAFRQRSYVGF